MVLPGPPLTFPEALFNLPQARLNLPNPRLTGGGGVTKSTVRR